MAVATVIKKRCPRCRTRFIPRVPHQVYCCDACAMAMYRRRKKARRA
jgi:ribosomal protein L37AE/L43A